VPGGGHMGHIHVNEAKPATIAHEIGHGMERTRRALAQAEWVFLRRRASSDVPERNFDYQNQFVYPDAFMDDYIGRAYYSHADQKGYRAKNFEVFTRGMEWVTGYGKMMRTQEHKDPDFRAFVVGALAVM
jgi:hypothetical protein